MTYYFWLGVDAEPFNLIEIEYEGDWEAWAEDEEMRRLGY